MIIEERMIVLTCLLPAICVPSLLYAMLDFWFLNAILIM